MVMTPANEPLSQLGSPVDGPALSAATGVAHGHDRGGRL